MRNKYDIVIIGSGIGSLTSSALLADGERKILIIEKEPKPGGYLTEFKADDFAFDVSLHLLNNCSEGQYAHDVFKRCGILDDIKFLTPKYLYRSIFPDFDLRIPQHNLSEYKENLKHLFPRYAKNIDTLFAEMADVFKVVNNYILFNKVSTKIAPYLKHSFEDMVNRQIKDKKLKAIICQLWIYFGLPPSGLRTVDFCYPWFDYTNNGGCYVENGSYAIVKALVNNIANRGGEFLFNKNVGRIMVNGDSCRKVTFGRDEALCDTLISNVDLTKTIYELIGVKEFPAASIKKFKSIEPSISAFEIFLGLDVDLRHIYPDDYEIFVNSDYDVNKQYADSLHSNAKTAPFVITLTSNVNRTSATPGKSVVTIIMLSGYDYWASKSRGEYQDKKQRIADILIKRASEIIPEIKTHVQKNVISTPVTFERYTNNSRGAIYGYSWTSGKNGEVRLNEIKKFKNLYFASAWAHQGSGIVKVLRSADDVVNRISKETRVQVSS